MSQAGQGDFRAVLHARAGRAAPHAQPAESVPEWRHELVVSAGYVDPPLDHQTENSSEASG